MYRKRLTIELLPEEEERAKRWRIAAIKAGKTLRDWLVAAADKMEADAEPDRPDDRYQPRRH